MTDFAEVARLLADHRKRFEARPLLRRLYHAWYERMATHLPTGRVLEVGGGGGHFKDWRPGTLSSDLVRVPWLDLVCDAQRLAFPDGAFAGVVGVDVLHHLPRPLDFLREAARVLEIGGRLVLHEPHLSIVSLPVYAFLHHEKVDLGFDPFADGHRGGSRESPESKDPMDGNSALPWILFVRGRRRLASAIPELRLVLYEPTATLAYPLSGGYDQLQVLPDRFAAAVFRVERLLSPLAPWLSYRALIVLERTDRRAPAS